MGGVVLNMVCRGPHRPYPAFAAFRTWRGLWAWRAAGLAAVCALALSAPAVAQSLTADTPVRVLVNKDAPFVMLDQDEQFTGFSVELWREIAARLQISEFIEEEPDFSEMLERVARREADVAIANISITSERELKLDFSQSYFDSGMQIVVRSDAQSTSVVRAVMNSPALPIAGIGLLVLLAIAHFMWIFERHRNPSIRPGYLGGVWDAFWWAFVALTTGGGDRPTLVVSRVLAMLWVLVGLFLVSSLTASITTWLTVQQLSGGIQDYRDLRGKKVGLIAGTIQAKFAAERGLAFAPYNDSDRLLEALTSGELDATILDAPVAQYFVAHAGAGKAVLAGPTFAPDKYGIAFPNGSELREPVNRALLEVIEDGAYERLRKKYFEAD